MALDGEEFVPINLTKGLEGFHVRVSFSLRMIDGLKNGISGFLKHRVNLHLNYLLVFIQILPIFTRCFTRKRPNQVYLAALLTLS
jgi:hypothetical protein